MPNRIIKESICTSDNIDQLTNEEEVFFYRLIVNCDDYGRADARAQIIRARCFPLRTDKVKLKDIENWLRKLVAADLVMVYEVDGSQYIQVVKWDKHQQKRAQHSKFPNPNEGQIHMISDDINGNQEKSNVPENRESRIENTRIENTRIRYAENVSMTEEEYQKLITDHGEEIIAECIKVLDNYKGAHGKKYKSDYRAILTWVIDKVKQQNKGGQAIETSERDTGNDEYANFFINKGDRATT